MAATIAGATGSGLSPGSRSGAVPYTGTDSIAALQGQIRQDRAQLNDWVTCVSATTPTGKEKIQTLSSRISAARERIARIEALAASKARAASGSASQSAQTRHAPGLTSGTASGRIDTWA